MSGGFRDESEDFEDLLISPSKNLTTSSYYQSEEIIRTTNLEDDISTNPFADMESSRVLYDLPITPSTSITSPSLTSTSPFQSSSIPTYSPILEQSNHQEDRFRREDAPEPESPIFHSSSSSINNATSFLSNEDILPPLSPPSSTGFLPLSPIEQTPFGSPPPLSSTSSLSNPYHSNSTGSYNNHQSKLDMSALLGEEKPTLPTFNSSPRRESNLSSSNKGSSLLLPISSIGNKHVNSALATLLGLEEDEPLEKKVEVEKVKPVVLKPEVVKEEPAPLPPLSLQSISVPPITEEALSTELPASPTLEELTSDSTATLTGVETEISKLSISTNNPTTTPTTSTTSIEEKRPLFSTSTSPTSPTSPTSKGFRTFNSAFDPEPSTSSSTSIFGTKSESELEESGGFNPTREIIIDDGASTRGNYSDSLREERGELESGKVSTGANSPTVDERDGFKSNQMDRSESIDSNQLPTLPNKSPPPPHPSTLPAISNQSNALPTRNVELGPSLGPSFVISVGDPQKIGSSLNVAAQHTVYTVRTKTTSTAFRKPEFSVLRRFSHFLWLFEALTLSNPGVIVPGMPEKSALGRFGSDFVENRRSALQSALMKMVSHPMLVGDPDLRLFLESDSFSTDIKQRRIDSPSESKGFLASLGNSISGPKFTEFDEYFENRKESLDTFELQLRSLLLSLSQATKVRTNLQTSLGELQSSLLSLSQCDLSISLKNALEQAAEVHKKVRIISEEQSASEEEIGGIISVAEGYARLCGSVRLVFGARVKAYHVSQAAESALRKARSAHEKSKRSRSDVIGGSFVEVSEAERKAIDTKRDFEDVSKLTRAEMVRFDKEKVEDFKRAIEEYIDGMVVRQREIVSIWQNYSDLLVRLANENNLSVVPTSSEVGSV